MIHGDVLGERARLSPDKTALVTVPTGERLSYRQLDLGAERCARLWESLGLGPGDRIGILAHNRREYVEAFFAAAKSGIALVTLGTRLTPAELEHIIRDSGMRALMYDAALSEPLSALRQRMTLDHWISLDEPAEGDTDYASATSAMAPERKRFYRADPESVHCLLYTSGTTGKPKGVMIPHRMVSWNGYNTACSWQLESGDVSSIFTPLYHAGGLMAFLVPIFTAGGTIVLHRGFDVAEIWRTIVAERCSVVLGVPTIWKMLLEAPEFQQADLTHVRWFISGGAPLPRYIIEGFQRKGVAFKQGFGMTEVGVNCFAMSTQDSQRKPGSIGRPMMFTEVRLVDEAGNEVPVDEVGELHFRGPHVSLGYWHAPEATATSRSEDGWFRSGDLARRDAEGFFYIAGRQKDMIISGGVNIYPAEIEAALLQHPDIEDAAVVGVPDEQWGEVGVAFVVAPGGPIPQEQLQAFLGERIARFKVPKIYRFADELPRTAYGKVVKPDLRQSYIEETS